MSRPCRGRVASMSQHVAVVSRRHTSTLRARRLTRRSPGWVRSVEKCRFPAQLCCGTSQRCVRPRRRT
eukprot:2510473-Prymnesium_polylepis.1